MISAPSSEVELPRGSLSKKNTDTEQSVYEPFDIDNQEHNDESNTGEIEKAVEDSTTSKINNIRPNDVRKIFHPNNQSRFVDKQPPKFGKKIKNCQKIYLKACSL